MYLPRSDNIDFRCWIFPYSFIIQQNIQHFIIYSFHEMRTVKALPL